MAIAIRLLQRERLIKNALIIDLDVHQGDGTAFIFSNDSSVFTCSIHCEKNFPGQKRNSDLDVGLPEKIGNSDYLAALDQTLAQVFDLSQPDIVLYNAGVDPHHEDILGKMNLTDEGIFLRDHNVLKACKQSNIPIATVIGGGYGKNLQALIERHALLFHAASSVYLNLKTTKPDNPVDAFASALMSNSVGVHALAKPTQIDSPAT